MKGIHKVAILGAGTMGARIAAHFANAGVPSYLLDIVPPDADASARNKFAAAGLDAAKKSKPAAFLDSSLARFVTIGNFDDDLKKLAEVDWIIEAVVENLDIKRSLLRKVEAIRKPGTVVTTNTSGLPVGKIAEGFSDDFRRVSIERRGSVCRETGCGGRDTRLLHVSWRRWQWSCFRYCRGCRRKCVRGWNHVLVKFSGNGRGDFRKRGPWKLSRVCREAESSGIGRSLFGAALGRG